MADTIDLASYAHEVEGLDEFGPPGDEDEFVKPEEVAQASETPQHSITTTTSDTVQPLTSPITDEGDSDSEYGVFINTIICDPSEIATAVNSSIPSTISDSNVEMADAVHELDGSTPAEMQTEELAPVSQNVEADSIEQHRRILEAGFRWFGKALAGFFKSEKSEQMLSAQKDLGVAIRHIVEAQNSRFDLVDERLVTLQRTLHKVSLDLQNSKEETTSMLQTTHSEVMKMFEERCKITDDNVAASRVKIEEAFATHEKQRREVFAAISQQLQSLLDSLQQLEASRTTEPLPTMSADLAVLIIAIKANTNNAQLPQITHANAATMVLRKAMRIDAVMSHLNRACGQAPPMLHGKGLKVKVVTITVEGREWRIHDHYVWSIAIKSLLTTGNGRVSAEIEFDAVEREGQSEDKEDANDQGGTENEGAGIFTADAW